MNHLKQTMEHFTDDETVGIPTHKLIKAVREKPALYDRSHPQYNDRKLKLEIWNEIGQSLFQQQWPAWKKIERRTAVCYIQKRWSNLRTTFAREVKKIIKSKQAGLECDGLIRWNYYKSMLFMRNFMTIQVDGASLDDDNDSSAEADSFDDTHMKGPTVKFEECINDEFEVQYLEDNSNDSNEFEVHNESSYDQVNESDVQDDVTPRKKTKKDPFLEPLGGKRNVSSVGDNDNLNKLKSNKATFNVSLQDISSMDYDVNFAMSLVPLLKELPTKKKLQAQIDILKIFKRYSEEDE